MLEHARRKEGLDDLGPGAIEEPLSRLLAAYAEADLSEGGLSVLRGGVVHALRMRLRSQEWFRRHPEIAEEQVTDPVVVVGMMRSGTTLLQRLLAADPAHRCAYGWEVAQVAPALDHDWAAPDPRVAAALERQELMRTFTPDLFAIHPMYAEEAEEEIVFLADAFLSHVPESGAHVPAYRAWLDTQDLTPAYDHLHRMLQLLQWQKRRRGEPGGRWVLKTPAHLGYLDTLRVRFPCLHLVHLHRDPRTTIASGASLNATLHALHSGHVDLHRLGADWLDRMGWATDRALATRDRWANEPEAPSVTDIRFDTAVADPLGQVARVYADLKVPLTPEARQAMTDWLQRRPREAGRPDYRLETYGLAPEQVDARFAEYRRRFLD
ncbi:MAG: sulfotransferase [Nocardioides sp.]|nr:sulfotransferase [Nocardioides sp.]